MALALLRLSEALRQLKRATDALTHVRRAVSILERLYGAEADVMVTPLIELAAVLTDAGTCWPCV